MIAGDQISVALGMGDHNGRLKLAGENQDAEYRCKRALMVPGAPSLIAEGKSGPPKLKSGCRVACARPYIMRLHWPAEGVMTGQVRRGQAITRAPPYGA